MTRLILLVATILMVAHTAPVLGQQNPLPPPQPDPPPAWTPPGFHINIPNPANGDEAYTFIANDEHGTGDYQGLNGDSLGMFVQVGDVVQITNVTVFDAVVPLSLESTSITILYDADNIGSSPKDGELTIWMFRVSDGLNFEIFKTRDQHQGYDFHEVALPIPEELRGERVLCFYAAASRSGDGNAPSSTLLDQLLIDMGLFTVVNEPLVEIPTNDDVSLRVYPNPVRSGDGMTLEFTASTAGSADIRVYDMLGRQVSRNEVTFVSRTNGVPLDTGGLPLGVYIIHLRVSEAVLSQRFTVLR